jgi:outer membrane lipoprotein-sorting protein
MWIRTVSCLVACLLGVLFLSAQSVAIDMQAVEVMKKLQRLLRSETNIARYTMHVITPDWERTMRLEAWDDLPGKRFFIRILSPKKDRDTTFLKVGPNLWMYIPKLERDIRIPPSMMLSSWMGSDFTNDDLVKFSSVVEDYHHRIVRQEGDVLIVESIPKPDAAVVWGKLVHYIQLDGLPLLEEFYDEDGNKVRVMHFEEPKEMGGRRIPSRWVMEPLNKPGHRTVMEIEQIQFDAPIPPSVFERANLRRRRH